MVKIDLRAIQHYYKAQAQDERVEPGEHYGIFQ
jgi:hypothetical protein